MSTDDFKNIILMKNTLGKVDTRDAPAFSPAEDLPAAFDW